MALQWALCLAETHGGVRLEPANKGLTGQRDSCVYEGESKHHAINLLKSNDIYIYIYIYMSYRSANLQTLHFKYLFNKYT